MTGCYRNHCFCCFISSKISFSSSPSRLSFIPRLVFQMFGCTERWSCSFLSPSLCETNSVTGCPVTDDHHWICNECLWLPSALCSLTVCSSRLSDLFPTTPTFPSIGQWRDSLSSWIFLMLISVLHSPSHVEQKWLMKTLEFKKRGPPTDWTYHTHSHHPSTDDHLSFLSLPFRLSKRYFVSVLSFWDPLKWENEMSEWMFNVCIL